MCKFPKGTADFEEIRTNGYVYIDKTKYIELLENSGNKSVHLLRPKRFGKSLFTSMLQCYYDLKMSNAFDKLFKGTYIYEHPTEKKNQYYILKFNFAGLGNKQGHELEKLFDRKVYIIISAFCEKYGFENTIPADSNAAQSLFNLIEILRNKIKNRRLYVLIDEYDHFANDLLSFHFEEFATATRSDGFIRAFYEELKNGTEGVIEKIFITGVSPITLDSLTSGFNISTNLSLDSDYNEIMGFTSEEMKFLISCVDGIKDPEALLSEMKLHYDGYVFSKDAKKHLYNPNMALYYLDHYQKKGKEPESIIDPNIFSDYSKIKNLLDIQPDKEQSKALLEIMTEEKISCQLTLSYNLQKDFSRNDFVSLLYYLGYLTIQGRDFDDLIFVVPNDVIRIIYFDYFNEMLKQNYQVYTDNYKQAVKQLLNEQKNNQLVACVEETLSSIDNRDYLNFDEKIIKMLLTSILLPSDFLRLKSEYPVEKGYIDLVLFPKNIEAPIMLIELKYIKASDFSEQKLQKKRMEAYDQIQNYGSAKEFNDCDSIKWILIFSKNRCVLNERIDKSKTIY